MKSYFTIINQLLSREIDPAYARRAKWSLEFIDIKIGKEKVLEIGCGRGFYLKGMKEMEKGLEITGVDLNEKYLKIAAEVTKGSDIRLVKADATKLPFPDSSFDRVLATEILEHIPNDEAALKEIRRVLRKGGILVVTVPNKNYPFWWDPANWLLERTTGRHLPSHIWWLSGIWADHVRLYTGEEIEERLKRNGFRIRETRYATKYCIPFSHFLYYGIGKNLVELGLFPSMNRFEKVKRRPSVLMTWIQKVIKLADKKNNQGMNGNTESVNIVIKAERI